MSTSQELRTPATRTARICARVGCHTPVKKATAKYCSVSCCATDPQRRSALRERSRNAAHQMLPLSRQLSIPFGSYDHTEQVLALLCEGREDAPLGMRRLIV
jgi:hypothetical protein